MCFLTNNPPEGFAYLVLMAYRGSLPYILEIELSKGKHCLCDKHFGNIMEGNLENMTKKGAALFPPDFQGSGTKSVCKSVMQMCQRNLSLELVVDLEH